MYLEDEVSRSTGTIATSARALAGAPAFFVRRHV